MEGLIELNVSGRKFVVHIDTLNKIPYFHNAIKDFNMDLFSAIFVNRSPMLFDHVLAFVIDNKYPYPVEYFSELDYYDIQYDKDKLYSSDKVLKEQICELKNKFNVMGNCVNSIYQFNADLKSNKCAGKNCIYDRLPYELYCKSSSCLQQNCFTKNCNRHSKNKYCDDHVMTGKRCNNKKCINPRMIDDIYCYMHI